ncbi:MAG TPA: hypothetical protein VFH14_00375, partial [Gemmatimonadaceae bacterium]|nr:hypothetical protein [Gemmatimonadaceae bacterium]
MNISNSAAVFAVVATVAAACAHGPGASAGGESALGLAAANDNRTPAGVVRGNVLHLDLDAVRAGWRPDL